MTRGGTHTPSLPARGRESDPAGTRRSTTSSPPAGEDGRGVSPASKPQRLGLVACGALAREVQAIVKLNRLDHVTARFLPARLHNTPRDIPAAVDAALAALAPHCDRLLVGYADCGTAGKLDAVLEKHRATRLPGAHCYAFFAGLDVFDALQDAEPGTFYLTDYLVRQFDTLVFRPLGLDRHPELLEAYFGNYTRVMHLSQVEDVHLTRRAMDAARRLGLRYERRDTGYGLLARAIEEKAA